MPELPDPADGAVVDGVVVVVAAPDDVPLDDWPVAAFAIATALPAIAAVQASVASSRLLGAEA